VQPSGLFVVVGLGVEQIGKGSLVGQWCDWVAMDSQVNWKIFSFSCLVAKGEQVCRNFFFSRRAGVSFALGSGL